MLLEVLMEMKVLTVAAKKKKKKERWVWMQSEENILALLNQVEQEPLLESKWKEMHEDGWCIRGKILWKGTEVLVVEISTTNLGCKSEMEPINEYDVWEKRPLL